MPTTKRGNAIYTNASSGGSGRGRGCGSGGLVSDADRSAFVEAVAHGKLTPDATAVAYHFEGCLDKDVMDAVLEATSDPTEAVSVLAGMHCPTPPAVGGSDISGDFVEGCVVQPPRTPGDKPALPPPVTGAAGATEAAPEHVATGGGKQRRAATLEAMQAHRGSCLPPVGPSGNPATSAAGHGGGTDWSDARDVAAESSAGEVHTGVGKDSNPRDNSNSESKNEELEKVAAFIANYAGEQEAASRASRAAANKPEATPFFVSPGMSAPSTRRTQLVIAKTAEKAVELPGFEAFMKIQHGNDTIFRFLATGHSLHGYYLLAKNHVQETVMHGGKAKGACSAAPRSKSPLARPRKKQPPEDPDVAEIMRMLGGVGP